MSFVEGQQVETNQSGYEFGGKISFVILVFSILLSSIMYLQKKANRKILLSGTPALSRPAELFSQIRIVDQKVFTNWTAYAKRYCDYRKGRFGYEAKGAEHLDELAAILNHSIMIRLVSLFLK